MNRTNCVSSQPRLRLSLLASLLLGLLSLSSASAQVLYDGILFARTNRWDSYPAHLFINGTHHLWWCGQSGIGSSFGPWVDAIFKTSKNGSLGPGGWSAPAQVFNHTNSPWANNHVCDPTVVRGTFTFSGQNFTYALYYTADTNLVTPGVDNAVGLAFSNDGVSWVAYPSIVITTNGPFNGTYGAGAGGVARDPSTGKLLQAYDDSTMNPSSRYKESSDGITFTPTPPLATQLLSAGGPFSGAPDWAYNALDGHWYAVTGRFTGSGDTTGEIRVLRANSPNSVTGTWSVLGIFDRSITSQPANNNAGLGKNADSSLYVDAQGWAYVFFGTGDAVNPWKWDLAQGRFRPGGVPTEVLVKVNATLPGRLTVTTAGDPASTSFAPTSAVVAIAPGVPANTDNLWNAVNGILSKPGFDGFVGAPEENPPLVTIRVTGLLPGSAYSVYGRFGTAPLQVPPNYVGIEMGLSSASLTRYDQTTAGTTLIGDWGNWQDREVFIGGATVAADGTVSLFIDENSVSQSAVWTGLRLVKQ